MYFDTLHISNFGPFREFDISLSPLGINVITGVNGTGKTQLIGAIVFSLVGADAVDFRPTGQVPSEVVLAIREDSGCEVITCRLDEQDPLIKDPRMLVDRRISRSPSGSASKDLAEHLLEMLTAPGSPSLLFALETEDDLLTEQELDSLTGLRWRDRETQRMWAELRKGYERARSSTRGLSLAQRRSLRFAQEFVRRQYMNRSVPLLVDDGFLVFDQTALNLVGDLLERIGRRDQVIILALPDGISKVIEGRASTCRELELPCPRFLGSLSYNYYPSPARRLSTPRGRVETRFVLGHPMRIEENRYCEFKEVKGTNPVRAIGAVVDQYAVAFLNMGSHGIGRIYWGVRDADRMVVGVKLSHGERDKVRRLVTDKLHQVQPPIAPSAYEVKIHHICDSGGIVPDLCIVEVKVPSSPSDILYATGSREVYVKTDAGKKRLSPFEIQQEVLRRHTHNRQDAE